MTDFHEIPVGWEVPSTLTEVTDAPNPDMLEGMPLNVCVLGVTSKKEAQNILYKNITVGQANSIFEAGSMMAQAVAAFYAERPDMTLWAIAAPCPDGALPASGSFAFSGQASANATGALYLGGVKISFPIPAGANPSDVVQAIVTAASAKNLQSLNGLVLSQDSKNAGTLNVTAGEGGEVTNQIDIRFSPALGDQIPGISCNVTSMSGGAGAPDISSAITEIGDEWVTDLLMIPIDADALTAAAAEARRRANAMVAKDMRVFAVLSASQGTALALSEKFNTHNELILLPAQNPKFLPWNAVAAIGAQVAQAMNNDPARQLKGVVINRLAGLAPEKADLYLDNQRNVLLQNGCSTFLVASDGTFSLERIVTTRTVEPTSNTASGVIDVMMPSISARIRYEWDEYVKANYPNYKLANEDSPIAGLDGVVTPRTLKGSWAGQCGLYQRQGWVDDVDAMVKKSTFVRSVTNPMRVDSVIGVKCMDSLMILANKMEVIK